MKILKLKVFAIIFLTWTNLSARGGALWQGTLKDFDNAKVDVVLIMLEDGRRFVVRSDGVAMAAVTNSGLDSAFGPLDKVAYDKFYPRLEPFLTETAKDRTDITIIISQINPKLSATAYVPRNKEVLEILREIASIVTPRNPQRFYASLERNPIKGLEDLVFGDKAAKHLISPTVQQPVGLPPESGNPAPIHTTDPKPALPPPISSPSGAVVEAQENPRYWIWLAIAILMAIAWLVRIVIRRRV